MPKDQLVDQDQDMRKFRKGSADAVGQFDEETVTFFFFLARADMSQVSYLSSVTTRFLTMVLVIVVS